jgi:hypothetical protein
MIKSQDLNPKQRRAFDMWRRLGLSEQSALRAMEQDGQVTLSEEERQARMFSEVFGLSPSGARHAVKGLDGPSRRPASGPVSEAGRSSSRPEAGDALRVVRKIEELAAGMCSGVSRRRRCGRRPLRCFASRLTIGLRNGWPRSLSIVGLHC